MYIILPKTERIDMSGELYGEYPEGAPTLGFPWYKKEKAPHLGHVNHLCDMAERGVDLNTYKELVKDPKFICRKCGRAAAKAENLCEPVPL